MPVTISAHSAPFMGSIQKAPIDVDDPPTRTIQPSIRSKFPIVIPSVVAQPQLTPLLVRGAAHTSLRSRAALA